MKHITLLTFMLLSIFCYSQNNIDNHVEKTTHLAIENQDGIQVTYIIPEEANSRYFILEIKNLSSSEKLVTYKVSDATKQSVASSNKTIIIKPGEVFRANDQTLAVYFKNQAKLSDYATELTIK